MHAQITKMGSTRVHGDPTSQRATLILLNPPAWAIGDFAKHALAFAGARGYTEADH